jgi:mannose-6-phosphate isomerase
MLHPLANTVQHYPWGSPDALRELYGFESPDRAPMAELWMGAHPKAPSLIVANGRETPLDRFIGEHPERTLGVSAGRFHGRLPFLLKVL